MCCDWGLDDDGWLDRRGRLSFMDPKAAARWSEKCCLRGLADCGGDGYPFLLDLGVVWPICETVAEGALASDEALERRYGFVSIEFPVC